MKAKASIILFSVIFVIILGSISTYFILKPEQEAVFPLTCSSSTTQQYTNSFTCPNENEVDDCSAILRLTCNQQSGQQPLVKFRTNAINGDYPTIGRWVAWDVDNDNDLDCFSINSNPPPSCNLPIINSILLPENLGGFKFYGNTQTIFKKRVEVPSNYCAEDRYRLLAGAGCDLTPTPKAPYSTNNQEIYSGNIQTYSCNVPYTINSNSNPDWKLTYSGSSLGTTTRTVNLNPGQTIRFSPTSPNIGSITGSIARIFQSQCTQDQPIQGNNRQYKECISGNNGCGVLGQTKTCPEGKIFKSSLASQNVNPPCEVPYTVKVNYLNKSIIGIPYHIDIDVDDSLKEDDLNVRVSIVGKSIFDSAFTNNDGKVDFDLDIDNLAPGFYMLKVEVTNHPSGIYNRTFTFELIEPFTVQLDIDNLAPSNDKPIEAICRTESGDRLINANVEFEAIWEGVNIEPTRRTPILGFVKAEYTINGEGPLRVRCRATYQEYTSAWTNYQTINVRTAGIRIVTEFTSGSGVCDGKFYTQKFKTLDPQGTAIDTDNLVKLKGPGIQANGETMQLSPEATGEYSFSYFFKNSGLYTVNIDSSKEGFAPTSLNAGNGASITINSCDGDNPGGNIIWYIVGFVVITGIIVFFIFRRRK